MKKGLRFIFLNILGGIVGVCLLLAYIYHKSTGGNLKQDLGWALPPAPPLVSTGMPGRVYPVNQWGRVKTTPPQAAGDGKKRWDVVLFDKNLPSFAACGLMIVGENSYDEKGGGLIATWYPLSFVSNPAAVEIECFAPPRPVTIATGSPERTWTKQDADVLQGPKPLGIGPVRKIIGDPELEEIDGKYSKFSGDEIKTTAWGQEVKIPGSWAGGVWKWTLISQTDIYRFKNRAGYLKITYDGRGISTKIEDGTARK